MSFVRPRRSTPLRAPRRPPRTACRSSTQDDQYLLAPHRGIALSIVASIGMPQCSNGEPLPPRSVALRAGTSSRNSSSGMLYTQLCAAPRSHRHGTHAPNATTRHALSATNRPGTPRPGAERYETPRQRPARPANPHSNKTTSPARSAPRIRPHGTVTSRPATPRPSRHRHAPGHTLGRPTPRAERLFESTPGHRDTSRHNTNTTHHGAQRPSRHETARPERPEHHPGTPRDTTAQHDPQSSTARPQRHVTPTARTPRPRHDTHRAERTSRHNVHLRITTHQGSPRARQRPPVRIP